MSEKLQNALEKFLKQFKISDFHQIKAINTDSRTIKPGDLFIPFKGANFDAHQFIFDSLIQGASLALSELSEKEVRELPNYSSELSSKVIHVKSTLQAYHDIANIYKNLVNPLCIGVTGSSGKTTTKELLKTVLSEKYRVHATEANYNNEFGVPKTILDMPESTEILIVEMAMRGLNQIDLLSKTTEPNIALITNIGTAHIELLGSVGNIRKAKMEILAGICDYHGWIDLDSIFLTDSNLYKFLQENKFLDPNTGSKAKVKKIIGFDYQANFKLNGLISKGIMADINAIAIIAKALGISDTEIQAALFKYKPGKGRGEFIKDQSGNIYIDETYNANPEAIRNSIEALMEQFPNENKIVVIGLVLESQDLLINDLFNELETKCKQGLFTFIDARNQEIESIKNKIQTSLKQNMQNIILIKASRGAKLERIFN